MSLVQLEKNRTGPPSMTLYELAPGRYLLRFPSGLALDVLLCPDVSAAFWRFNGKLIAEARVGES